MLDLLALTRAGAVAPVYNMTVQGEHLYRVAKCGVLVHNNYTIRIRHYTNRQGAQGIRTEGVIRARDQNKVFAERVRGKPLSRVDAEKKYGLKPGRGRDIVETDVAVERVSRVKNPRTGVYELQIEGDVNLENAQFIFRN